MKRLGKIPSGKFAALLITAVLFSSIAFYGCTSSSADRFVQTELEVTNLTILCDIDVDTTTACDTLAVGESLDLKIHVTFPDRSVSFDDRNSTVEVDSTVRVVTITPIGKIDRSIGIVRNEPETGTIFIQIGSSLLSEGIFDVKLRGKNKTITDSVAIVQPQ